MRCEGQYYHPCLLHLKLIPLACLQEGPAIQIEIEIICDDFHVSHLLKELQLTHVYFYFELVIRYYCNCQL